MTKTKWMAVLVLVLFWVRPALTQDDQSHRLGGPSEPVSAILGAFDSHNVVALSLGTHSEEIGSFRLSLIRDPRFPETVDEIVVYFGNSLYQETIDRYVRGDDVAYDDLKKVWQNTTQPHHGWDLPIYEAFYREIRSVNSVLSEDDQLRVILADPPIDWDRIKTFQELLPWLQRRVEFFTGTVAREAAAGRRLLIIGGASFFARSGPGGAPDSEMPIERIEQASGGRAFLVWTTMFENLSDIEEDATSWSRPSLALVSGTKIGGTEYNNFSRDNTIGTVEDHFDAVLYLGSAGDLVESRLDPELCSDREYLAMRLPRLQIAADGGGEWLEDFQRYCGSVVEQ